MAKRKRTAPLQATTPPSSPPPPPPDMMPCSSRMNLVSREKSLLSVDSSELKPLSSIMDVTDSSMKLQNTHPSLSHHHYNLSRSIFLKRSRHYYGHQYFRRNSIKHANTSTSHGKGTTPLRNEGLSVKLASQCNLDSRCHAENREKASCRPERIRSSSLVMDAALPEVVKMVCGICQKVLRRKPYSLGSTLSNSDLSVVAVLVCGHVYHADCLEQQTCHEDRRDPPCPMCISLLSKFDASKGQE
ncbi:hypothetical protein L1049_000475 [Liquidambar formosana]|uniref:RING-type domain-containing protein n=1 Tax=Liquidambar formosana TaxID=63359 RepID=A0AAP0NCU5_LIQFO